MNKLIPAQWWRRVRVVRAADGGSQLPIEEQCALVEDDWGGVLCFWIEKRRQTLAINPRQLSPTLRPNRRATRIARRAGRTGMIRGNALLLDPPPMRNRGQ